MSKLIFLLLAPISLFAVGNNVNNTGGKIMTLFKNATDAWYSIFVQEGLFIFGILALIGFILEMSFKFLQNDFDMGSVMASLIRNIIIFGLFTAFIQSQYLNIIFSSFKELADSANSAAGVSVKISPDTLMESAYTLLTKVSDGIKLLDIADSILLVVIGVMAAILIVLLSVEMLMVYAKVYIMLAFSPIFLALGALSYTRHWAMSTITATMQASMEYMLIKLIVGLSLTFITAGVDNAMNNDGSLFSLFIMVLVLYGITKMIHPLATSFFNGTMAGNNSSAFGSTARAVGGATSGAVGGGRAGYSAVKEAASKDKNDGGSGDAGSFRNTMGATMGGIMGGAISGATKGVMGKSTHNVGSESGKGSGAMAGRKLGGSETSKKSSSSSSGKPSEKEKYTSAVDPAVISGLEKKSAERKNNSNSMQGEIKPS